MKTWVVLIVLGAMLSVMADAEGAEVPTVAVESAAKHLGLRERTNNNDHPEIDKMLAYCGVPPRNSWCMAFVQWHYGQAATSLHTRNPLYRSARCYTVWRSAVDNPLRHYIIKPEEVLAGKKIPVGAVAVWRSGSAARNRNWNGHTGLVLAQKSARLFVCREGNTMPSAKGNQREGGGVYDRVRGYGLGTTFEVQGWIYPR